MLISVEMYTILEYGQCFLYLNNGGILGTDFWLIRLKLMPLYSCSWKNVQGSRGIPERILQRMENAAFCRTERKYDEHF